MPDPLATVLRIRRVTVDDARRQLAAALQAEDQANVEAEAAETAIGAEGEIAADLTADDRAVEAYAAWLPVGRAKAAAARAACERAGSEVGKARAAVTVARAAAESAKNLLERRRAALTIEATRRAQADTDEVASRVRVPAGR